MPVTEMLELRPLLDLLTKEDGRAMSAPKFARLVDDHLTNVRAALHDGYAEEAQAKQWAIAAGYDPEVVWPPKPDPIDTAERMERVRAAEPLLEAASKKATELFMDRIKVAGEHAVPVIRVPSGDLIPLDFHDELPPARLDHRGRHTTWLEILEPSCKANPGKWLRIMERPSSILAGSRRKAIKAALGEGWEVEVRPNKPTDTASDPHFVWVRWVG